MIYTAKLFTGGNMNKFTRYFLILLAVILLWNTYLVKPLKIFTVFLHELGHVLMAFLFGYGIQSFNVNINESGHVVAASKGWFSSFMIANGGYLGSVFFAVLILYLGRTKFKNFIPGILAIVFSAICLKFSGFSFALFYAVCFGIVVIIIYMINKPEVIDWFIDIVGISSVAYAIYDTFVDTILIQVNLKFNILKGVKISQPLTDAFQLQKLTGIPAIIWGIIWLCIAVFGINAIVLKGQSSKK